MGFVGGTTLKGARGAKKKAIGKPKPKATGKLRLKTTRGRAHGEKGKGKEKEAPRSRKAFDAARFDGSRFNPFEVVIIGIDTDGTFHSEMYQKRRNSIPVNDAKDKTSQEFYDSIRRFGVKKPILVRKIMFSAGEKVFGKKLAKDTHFPVVLAGRQRVKNARQVTLDVRNESASEKFVSWVKGVYENGIDDATTVILDRQLNHCAFGQDFLDDAEAAKKLYDQSGGDEAYVLKEMNWGPQRLSEAFALLSNGVSELKEAVRKKEISGSAAVRLAQYLPAKEQKEELKNAVQTGKTSIKDIEGAINRRKAKKGTKKKRTIKNAKFSPEIVAVAAQETPAASPAASSVDRSSASLDDQSHGYPTLGRRQLIAIFNELENMENDENGMGLDRELENSRIMLGFVLFGKGLEALGWVKRAIQNIQTRVEGGVTEESKAASEREVLDEIKKSKAAKTGTTKQLASA
jgi:hypothetical protein